jgi:hypothetical protein
MNMIQANQIGKKRDYRQAQEGRQFLSPNGKTYSYAKGSRGIIVIEYLGHRMQIKTKDFNSTPIDSLLGVMEKEVL